MDKIEEKIGELIDRYLFGTLPMKDGVRIALREMAAHSFREAAELVMQHDQCTRAGLKCLLERKAVSVEEGK